MSNSNDAETLLPKHQINAFEKLVDNINAEDKMSDEEILHFEEVISSNPILSFMYAMGRHSPFEKGEAAISTNAWTSYCYASGVLKGRFPAGEESIFNSSNIMAKKAHYHYIDMLEKRDPLVALKEDSKCSMPLFSRKRRKGKKTK